ncbi:ATP-grasp domain-containing protein [Adhaeretor mobilis]|uniref:Carbamoyl phosphate synthase large subunit n=1 Tax=Adhaeretor mobilis TaxID=1930276 RepID=A0A517MR66_9BACT|nr:ATP-grasp domain-containing protein [Adhaeretor mobilis]QDS97287.1 carbamoyl phosphate synthase large subunit [Adhaeretor mobilis]
MADRMPSSNVPPLRRLAIVGASARAAAYSAIRAGYEVVICDLFADADLRVLGVEVSEADDYPNDFLGWLVEQSCDGWLYTGGLENFPALVDRMASCKKLLGNTGDQLSKARSPTALAKLFPKNFPPTLATSRGLPTDGSWLAKSYCGAGGSGVRVHTDSGSTQAPFYQKRIDGKQSSATFVANGKQATLLGVTEQLIGEPWTGADEFQYCGSITGLELSSSTLQLVERIGQTLAMEFGLQGIFGIDFILEDEQIWLLEVNPRWPASLELLEQAGQFSGIALHVAACWEEELPGESFLFPSEEILGKAILFTPSDICISKKFTSDCLTNRGTIEVPQIADIPNFGTIIPAGRPVCTVFATGENWAEVRGDLQGKIKRPFEGISTASQLNG